MKVCADLFLRGAGKRMQSASRSSQSEAGSSPATVWRELLLGLGRVLVGALPAVTSGGFP